MRKWMLLLFFHIYILSFAAFFTEEDKDVLRKEQYQRQERKMKEWQEEKSWDSLAEENVLPSGEEESFYIKSIVLVDEESLLDPIEREYILGKYQERKMDAQAIQRLLRELTQQLMKKGYITSVASLAEENDLRKEELKLQIVPGRIEKIVLNGDAPLDRLKKKFLFCAKEGDVLNVRALDSTSENFNYLEANEMKMEILPGSKENYSIVKVKNKMKEKFRISLLTNNHGDSKQNSLWRYGVSLNIDSPLGIGDRLYYSYMTVHKKRPNRDWKRHSDIVAPGEILPIGPPGYNPKRGDKLPYKRNLNLYHLRYTMKWREYSAEVDASKTFQESSMYTSNTIYDFKSINHSYGIALHKILWRNQKNKLSFGVGIKKKHLENYLETSCLADRKLSIGEVSLHGDFVVWKGLLGVTLAYERGLRALGAESDKGKLAFTPKAEFNKYRLVANYYKALGKGFAYRMNLASSYSGDVLYGSERQNIGGVGSVAGFHRKGSIQGDQGFEIEQEVSYQIKSEHFGKWTPYLSYSYGAMRQNENKTKYGKGFVSGMLLGLRYQMKYMDFDVAYAKPLQYSTYLKPRKQEIYFSGSFKIRF